jgi:hypothetical protein
MNKLIETFKNTKANDLPKCKSIGNWFGWFFVTIKFLAALTYLTAINTSVYAPFFIWCGLTFLGCCVSYVFGRWFGIALTFPLFYFVELVSPRKEKSYLPNEPREE